MNVCACALIFLHNDLFVLLFYSSVENRFANSTLFFSLTLWLTVKMIKLKISLSLSIEAHLFLAGQFQRYFIQAFNILLSLSSLQIFSLLTEMCRQCLCHFFEKKKLLSPIIFFNYSFSGVHLNNFLGVLTLAFFYLFGFFNDG